jgi:serpin B
MSRLLRLAVLGSLLFASCQMPLDQELRNQEGPAPEGTTPSSEAPGADPQPKNRVAADNNAFAFDLYAQVRGQKGNLFFSPASVSTALAMTYAGAQGTTAAEMAHVMHFNMEQEKLQTAFAALLKDWNSPPADRAERGYELAVANSLWGQADHPWEEPFLKLTKSNYGAGFHAVDFTAGDQARLTINAWAQHETRDKIKDLFPPGVLSKRTGLVLANAIYFKGDWAEPFKSEMTQLQKFFLTPTRDVKTSLMSRTGDYRIFANDDLQMLELPYKGNELMMLVILPRKLDGLDNLEANLTAEKCAQYVAKLSWARVAASLPKFKMTRNLPLTETLQEMGMKAAFSPRSANFRGMAVPRSPSENLFIHAVLHKAFVEVNEKGSEAAAVTAVEMAFPTAAPTRLPDPTIFRADHPFVFVIRDNRNGSILFMGRFADPTE